MRFKSNAKPREGSLMAQHRPFGGRVGTHKLSLALSLQAEENMQWPDMSPTTNGPTETAREATGAENSKNSFNVLTVSLVLAVIAAVVLFWYFGIFPFHHAPTATTG